MVMSKASNENTGIIFERKFKNTFPLHVNTYAYVMTYARHDICLNMLEQTLLLPSRSRSSEGEISEDAILLIYHRLWFFDTSIECHTFLRQAFPITWLYLALVQILQ